MKHGGDGVQPLPRQQPGEALLRQLARRVIVATRAADAREHRPVVSTAQAPRAACDSAESPRAASTRVHCVVWKAPAGEGVAGVATCEVK
jgi:hypothetical protein